MVFRRVGSFCAWVLLWVAWCAPVGADVPLTLPLPAPGTTPTAEQIIEQVYFVNHFYALKNVAIEMDGRVVTVIVTRGEGGQATTNTVKRYLNNDYNDGVIKAKDLAIFTSGSLRGTGMLVTDFVDDQKSQSYSVWLPDLRKVRRFAQPTHEDAWGGTDFTFDDVTLRKPHHETHERLETRPFGACLAFMAIPEADKNWYMKPLPNAEVCDHRDKPVHVVKSTSRFPNWWYEYRVSYIDVTTFADYRTEYFKSGKMIKIIDRDWGDLNMGDPRGLYWKFWYGKNLLTNHETIAVVPREVFTFNTSKSPLLWSEETLAKIKQ
ncbi:MAG: outer membrane lipoprotein-sorting protein [Magnetococcales bacterium]|nr:outer membrane lipoprotein-sorting protein [Magnetococcales bacterium]